MSSPHVHSADHPTLLSNYLTNEPSFVIVCFWLNSGQGSAAASPWLASLDIKQKLEVCYNPTTPFERFTLDTYLILNRRHQSITVQNGEFCHNRSFESNTDFAVIHIVP